MSAAAIRGPGTEFENPNANLAAHFDMGWANKDRHIAIRNGNLPVSDSYPGD